MVFDYFKVHQLIGNMHLRLPYLIHGVEIQSHDNAALLGAQDERIHCRHPVSEGEPEQIHQHVRCVSKNLKESQVGSVLGTFYLHSSSL